jgi:cytochrome c556
MKRNTSAAVTTRDYEALEEAFHAMERFAPSADPLVVAAALSAGYPNWASIARDGAQAARIRDLDAVKAACRGCHEQYKAKYKAELRARTLP